MSKPKPTRHAPQEVDEYLARLPQDKRATLAQLRALIPEETPAVTERVSYQIPMFRQGQDLVGISAARNHCALHTLSHTVLPPLADELKAAGLKISGATLHFPPGIDIPAALVREVLKARLAELNADCKSAG